ncbi:MAG: AMP-binding protein [Rhodobacteraceae bacterium]|nr:AMP-binding protein [Paracoccaceae bacterium]
MTETLAETFSRAAKRFGARTALVEGDGTDVSFADLKARADRFAAAWAARGMRKGDRILVAMPVGADLYAALCAMWQLGAVAVLPEPAMGLAGVRHAVASAGVCGFCASGKYLWARVLVPGLWFKRLYRPAASGSAGQAPGTAVAGEDLALISFTSGSTGAPKAIGRSHGFLKAQEAAVAPMLASARDERDLVAFPVFALINLAEGRTSVLPNWPMTQIEAVTPAQLEAWCAIQNVTRALLPPALCETLAQGDIPDTVHTLFTGGGPVFPDLIARLRERSPGLRIVSVYGSTEAEPIAEIDADDVSDADLAAMQAGQGLLAGRTVPQVALRIEDGEILVTGDHVNKGYLDPARDAGAKVKEGGTVWHRTGDAGRIDTDGRLWLLGRHGASVKTEAGTLFPFAVETAARLWPGVARAALTEIGGQAVLALQGAEPSPGDWAERAGQLGVASVRAVGHIPLDRRHRSKVDYPALRKLLD